MRPGPASSTPTRRAHRPGALPSLAAVGLVLGGLLVGAPMAGASGAPGPNGASPGPAEVRLPGPAPTLPPGAQVVGPADGAASVTADLTLVPRHPAILDALSSSVSETGSPAYRQYLTTAQFAANFGATPTTVATIRNWLGPLGLEVGPVAPDGLLLPVTGTVATMERTFAVPLVEARLPGGRVARVGTQQPRVPQPLAGAIGGVIGLSTVPQAHPQIRTVPVGAAEPPGPSSLTGPTSGLPGGGRSVGHAGPRACPAAAAVTAGGGAWTADQLASAYGFDSLYGQGRSGVGQRVAIYELEPFTTSDIDAYQSCYGVHVPVSTVPVDGGATGTQSGEAALDIEAVAGLAPGSSIAVYSGPNSGAGPINTYAAMIDDRSNRVISTSWGQCEGTGGIDPAQQRAETLLFQQAAVQGQTVLAASGDSGSTDCYDPAAGINDTALAVDDPADQPDVTGVGGTSLAAAVPSPSSETVWNDGIGAGGGGVSRDFAAPTWQQIPDARNSFTVDTCGPTRNQQCREVPDVSASADPEHGDVIYFEGTWRRIGGTSAAAPLWAALTTVANQGCASPAGLLNPRLYAAGAGSSPPFNDATRGNNDLLHPSSSSPHYPATTHYDLASGWGSPRAVPLMGVFSGSASGCPSVTGLSSSSGPATGGRRVVVAGSGFGTGLPTVRFGRSAATVVSHAPASITVITPDVGSGATAAVTVTTTGPAGGTSAVVAGGTYTFISPRVEAVVPDRGPTSGGGLVTVDGSDLARATSVRFGSSSASFTVISATSLVARVPSGPSGGGSVDVSVTSPDGVSPRVTGDRYTYSLPGYWLVASDGGIFSYGHAAFYGSTGGTALNRPVVGMAPTSDGRGYWLVASDGGIFSYGDAAFYGSTGNITLNRPIVGMAPTSDGRGYWLVASDGGIFSYGDAAFYGSTGNITLNRPIVGMAPTSDGRGYWLVASDGGIFSYGDAAFYGSTGNITLNRPIVGMAPTSDGRGYWLVASDGGIFSYGDAAFYGSTGNITLNQPVVGMAHSLAGRGYWLVASDGGIFSYGDAAFYGSTGNITLNRPIVGMAAI